MGAFLDGRLSGLLAALPRTVRSGDSRVRVAELGEIFVHPDLQGRGVFRSLHKALLDELGNRGVQAVCCRPARDAGRILRGSFAYRKVLTIAAGEHRSNPGRIPPVPAGIEVAEEEAVGAEFADLEDGILAGRTATVRSPGYLARRYLANPTPYALLALRRSGRLLGWVLPLAVPRAAGPPDGYLVDSLVPPVAAVRRAAAAAALRWFEGAGCRRLFAWRADGPRDPPLLPDPHFLGRLKRLRLRRAVAPPGGARALRAGEREPVGLPHGRHGRDLMSRAIVHHFDAAAADHARYRAGETSFGLQVSALLGLVPGDPERILDLGCGSGALADCPGVRSAGLFGTDLSPAMLGEARRRGLQGRARRRGAAAVPGRGVRRRALARALRVRPGPRRRRPGGRARASSRRHDGPDLAECVGAGAALASPLPSPDGPGPGPAPLRPSRGGRALRRGARDGPGPHRERGRAPLAGGLPPARPRALPGSSPGSPDPAPSPGAGRHSVRAGGAEGPCIDRRPSMWARD